MRRKEIGKSGLYTYPLVLGGNVFGWTIDETQSFKILDAFVDRGFNFIDTADVYSRWAPGNKGGESETIIGKWVKKKGNRNKVQIATKVGMDLGDDNKGLKKKHIIKAVEDSLTRLQTDTIDLYQSHKDDLETDVSETLETFDSLIKAGKVRAIGASQLSPQRIKQSLKYSADNNITSYTCLQPLYNLYDRENFEIQYSPICITNELGVITYYSLASGFLSGKYRTENDLKAGGPRGQRVASAYFNDKGKRLIEVLNFVSQKIEKPMATTALAWILANPLVTAPIASATNLNQLNEIMDAALLKLDFETLTLLGSL